MNWMVSFCNKREDRTMETITDRLAKRHKTPARIAHRKAMRAKRAALRAQNRKSGLTSSGKIRH